LEPAPSAIEPISQAIDWQDVAAALPSRMGPSLAGQESGGRERSVNLDFSDKTAPPEPETEIGGEPDEGVQPELDKTLDTIRRAAALDVSDDKTLPGF